MYRKEQIKNHTSYQIDTNGVVYSKKGHPLKCAVNASGYQYVTFSESGRLHSYMVHRLVALQFLEPASDRLIYVNHIDGNKFNNHIDNLEWVTPSENIAHAINTLHTYPVGAKHTSARKILARDPASNEILMSFGSISDAAKSYAGDSGNYRRIETSIWRALVGKRHTYKGCRWNYSDDIVGEI